MFANISEWMDRPYSPDMSIWRWAAFIIFILIVCGVWISILNMLKD